MSEETQIFSDEDLSDISDVLSEWVESKAYVYKGREELVSPSIERVQKIIDKVMEMLDARTTPKDPRELLKKALHSDRGLDFYIFTTREFQTYAKLASPNGSYKDMLKQLYMEDRVVVRGADVMHPFIYRAVRSKHPLKHGVVMGNVYYVIAGKQFSGQINLYRIDNIIRGY